MVEQAGQVVFVVDDEQKECEKICEILEDSDIRLRYFTDPAECLEQIASRGCDLLITALKIPETDGVELMRQAKFFIPWLPVVIITAYGDIQTAVEAVHAGVADFIEKPLVKDDFIKKIRSLLPSSDRSPRLLSRTEVSVLRLVAMGKSSSEIAHLLHRSRRTVEQHRNHAMKKLGLRDFTDLLKRIGGAGVPEFLTANESDEGKAKHAENPK